MPSKSILGFQKIHLFLIRMGILEKGENPALTTLKSAASGHGGINLILRDKLLDRRYFRQLRGKGGAGQGQVLQAFPKFSGLVVVEPQQIPILLVCRPERGVFFRKGLTERRAIQLLGKPCGFFREPISPNTGQAGKIPGISGFLAEIVVQMPKFFSKEGAFIARRFRQLHVSCKLTVLQKLTNTLGGILPGNDLGGCVVTGRRSMGKMDTVLGIPCGNATDPVATVI